MKNFWKTAIYKKIKFSTCLKHFKAPKNIFNTPSYPARSIQYKLLKSVKIKALRTNPCSYKIKLLQTFFHPYLVFSFNLIKQKFECYIEFSFDQKLCRLKVNYFSTSKKRYRNRFLCLTEGAFKLIF